MEKQPDEQLNDKVRQALKEELQEVYARGYAAWQMGNYDRALTDFSWLVMTQPYSWRARVALAGVLMTQGEYQAAVNFYSYALILDNTHPEPLYQMGVCWWALGQKAQAREALQLAISTSYTDPEHSRIRENAEKMIQQLLV